jgi:hypothetical protein
MDHLAVLREKVGRLRAEIAQLQELHDRYWLRGRNETEAQIAHGQRHERLEAIQQELTQLANIGRPVHPVEQMKGKRRGKHSIDKCGLCLATDAERPRRLG